MLSTIVHCMFLVPVLRLSANVYKFDLKYCSVDSMQGSDPHHVGHKLYCMHLTNSKHQKQPHSSVNTSVYVEHLEVMMIDN
jgi:hypothetical protein